MNSKLLCPKCGVEIDEHEAGRCLDAWIHGFVMGKPVYTQDELAERNERGCGFIIVTMVGGKIVSYDDALMPRYSTDIAPAWKVMERTSKITGATVRLRIHPSGFYCVQTIRLVGKWLCCETMPLASCRTAIKAVSNATNS